MLLTLERGAECCKDKSRMLFRAREGLRRFQGVQYWRSSDEQRTEPVIIRRKHARSMLTEGKWSGTSEEIRPSA